MLRLWENKNTNTLSSPTLIEINGKWQYGQFRDLFEYNDCLFEKTPRSGFHPGKLLCEASSVKELKQLYPEYFI